MVIHQTISLSYDTIILSSAWLVIGYGFDFVYGSKKIKKIDMLVYMIASTIIITQGIINVTFVNILSFLSFILSLLISNGIKFKTKKREY